MSRTRQDMLAKLQADQRFDVVVVGGGVNGIGVYRELALQGLRVLLIEKNDFCSGCSSAPSRMIHGGLRYLENGEFSLVRESLRERDALLQTAPHLVRPLPTVIPINSTFSGLLNAATGFFGKSGQPSNRGAISIKLGLMLYDLVTRKRRRLPRHHFNTAKQTRQIWPGLARQAKFTAVYHDAWISHPERLCIEMIGDVASAAPDCVALNYAELEEGVGNYTVKCHRTGTGQVIQTRAVVNATGAWLDETAHELGNNSEKQMVSGTKGSHLIIDNPALIEALKGHMVYHENVDGRVCIVFPYLGHVLVGSTDIRVGKPKRVRCEQEELDYILDSLRLVFPEVPVDQNQVVFSFSGIRPLPSSDKDFTGRISRGHYVRRLGGMVPQFCMIGGKWTTFRAFGEQTADSVLEELGHERRCNTVHIPIGGGDGFVEEGQNFIEELTNKFGLSTARASHLVDHYGSNATSIHQYCLDRGKDEWLSDEKLAYTKNEIAYLVCHEQAETIADLILRRTSLAITGAISLELIDSLAKILAKEVRLSKSEITDQRHDVIAELTDYYGVSPELLNERNKKRSPQCV
ncbi:MAG: glycerol-3-phosphate dehydrogenase/oxidase [Rhizobiaceae bacterium]